MRVERYISQSQRANCDLARRYVGLNLSRHGETRKIDRTEIRKVATWKGGIMGPVECSYPNPKEWTLENIPEPGR